jgi:transposase-like protein
MAKPLPASCAALDLKKTRRALIKAGANVSAVAKKLGVPPGDLRQMLYQVPELIEAALEAEEQWLDEAEAELRRALKSPDMQRRLKAAGEILRKSPAAGRRGFGWRAPR